MVAEFNSFERISKEREVEEMVKNANEASEEAKRLFSKRPYESIGVDEYVRKKLGVI